MRHKDRETMDKIVKIIEEYRMERSEIPSIGQIAEKVHPVLRSITSSEIWTIKV